MTIKYAGCRLNLLDEDGTIQKWLNNYQNLRDLRYLSPEGIAQISGRRDSRSGNPNSRGLPRVNWPQPPVAKINSLYWPTGASRWAQGLFVCDRKVKDEITSIVRIADNPIISEELEISHPEGDTISAYMYLLAPRPVSPPSYSDGLWILPLVDERYLWQGKYLTNFYHPGYWESWDDAYSLLATALGIDAAYGIDKEAISSAYQEPDMQELSRSYESAAVILDAVAHSVGHRIVRDFDGTVTSMNWATSATRLASNQPLGNLVCGGLYGPLSGPTSLSVAFPKYADFHPYSGAHHLEIETNETGITHPDGTTHIIHSTMFADYSTRGGTADNTTALAALALQMKVDFAEFFTNSYDITLVGIQLWELTGWCDHILVDFGYQRANGSYAAHTRIQSLPYNFRVDEQLSQDDTLVVYTGMQWAKADGAIAARSGSTMQSATVSVYQPNASHALTDTGKNVKAWNGFGQAVVSGAWIQLEWITDVLVEGRWTVVSEDCP